METTDFQFQIEEPVQLVMSSNFEYLVWSLSHRETTITLLNDSVNKLFGEIAVLKREIKSIKDVIDGV